MLNLRRKRHRVDDSPLASTSKKSSLPDDHQKWLFEFLQKEFEGSDEAVIESKQLKTYVTDRMNEAFQNMPIFTDRIVEGLVKDAIQKLFDKEKKHLIYGDRKVEINAMYVWHLKPSSKSGYKLDQKEVEACEHLAGRDARQNYRESVSKTLGELELDSSTTVPPDTQKSACSDYDEERLPYCQSCAMRARPDRYPVELVEQAKKLECIHKNFRRLSSNNTVLGFGFGRLESQYTNPIWLYRSILPANSQRAADQIKPKPLEKQDRILIFAFLSELFRKLINDQMTTIKKLTNEPSRLARCYRYKKSACKACDVCKQTILNVFLLCQDCAMQVCEKCVTYRYASLLAGTECRRTRAEVDAPKFESLQPPTEAHQQISPFDLFNWPLCTKTAANGGDGDEEKMLATHRAFGDGRLIVCQYVEESVFENLLSSVHTFLKANKDAVSPEAYHLEHPVLPPSQLRALADHTLIDDSQMLLLVFSEHSLRNVSENDVFHTLFYRGVPFVYQLDKRALGKQVFGIDNLYAAIGSEQQDKTVVRSLDNEEGTTTSWEKFINVFKSADNIVYKIKDFPPNCKSSECHDLARVVERYLKLQPFRDYTLPTSKLNLINQLFEPSFIMPDISAKFNIATPIPMSENYLSEETVVVYSTGLHEDVFDASNTLVNIVNQTGSNTQREKRRTEKIEAYLNAISDELGDKQMERIRTAGFERVGALWIIYERKHRDTIDKYLRFRQLITLKEKGETISRPSSNAVHDQESYLTKEMRKDLKRLGAPSYAIVQLLGDTVFIPAGCPHQVQNLNSCIKIASDFLTPESMETVSELANEFRLLPATHQNSGDILQVPHLIYQSIKNCVERF